MLYFTLDTVGIGMCRLDVFAEMHIFVRTQ